jgi:hypothetical protein
MTMLPWHAWDNSGMHVTGRHHRRLQADIIDNTLTTLTHSYTPPQCAPMHVRLRWQRMHVQHQAAEPDTGLGWHYIIRGAYTCSKQLVCKLLPTLRAMVARSGGLSFSQRNSCLNIHALPGVIPCTAATEGITSAPAPSSSPAPAHMITLHACMHHACMLTAVPQSWHPLCHTCTPGQG